MLNSYKKEKFILGYKYLHNGGGKILQYKQTVGQAKLDLAKTTRENIILLEESNFTGTMDLGPYDSEKGLCREEHHLLKKIGLILRDICMLLLLIL